MIAFDTNILLYAYDTRDPRRQSRAADLIESTADGVLLWQVAVEFIANARRLRSQGITTEDAWAWFTDLRAILPLIVPTAQSLTLSNHLLTQHQLSSWDALIYAACIDAGITRLYSEDIPGSQIHGLEIVNPFL